LPGVLRRLLKPSESGAISYGESDDGFEGYYPNFFVDEGERSHAELIITTAISGTGYEEARSKTSSFTYIEAASNT